MAFRARTYGLALSASSAAYVERLLALPSMLAWDRAALVEPWRDEEHEVDALAVGTLVEDLRAPRSPR